MTDKFDALEAKIDEVSEALAADPKNKELAKELSFLLQDHESAVMSAMYRPR